jgi:hypothetical protein
MMFAAPSSRFLAKIAHRSLATNLRSASAYTRFFHATSRAEAKLNVEGLAQRVNLEGQNVLVRVDLNVPLDKVCTVLLTITNYTVVALFLLIGFMSVNYLR